MGVVRVFTNDALYNLRLASYIRKIIIYICSWHLCMFCGLFIVQSFSISFLLCTFFFSPVWYHLSTMVHCCGLSRSWVSEEHDYRMIIIKDRVIAQSKFVDICEDGVAQTWSRHIRVECIDVDVLSFPERNKRRERWAWCVDAEKDRQVVREQVVGVWIILESQLILW